MELTLLVYLANVVENLGTALGFVFIGLLLSLIPIGIYTAETDNTEKGRDCAKTVVTWMLGILFVLVFIPSERTMWVMAGAYATQQVAESKEASVIFDKVNQVIHQKLDEFLTEKEPAK